MPAACGLTVREPAVAARAYRESGGIEGAAPGWALAKGSGVLARRAMG